MQWATLEFQNPANLCSEIVSLRVILSSQCRSSWKQNQHLRFVFLLKIPLLTWMFVYSNCCTSHISYTRPSIQLRAYSVFGPSFPANIGGTLYDDPQLAYSALILLLNFVPRPSARSDSRWQEVVLDIGCICDLHDHTKIWTFYELFRDKDKKKDLLSQYSR